MQTSGMACESCSFVSVLFNSKAVREVGLPIKEFLYGLTIWSIQAEYTFTDTMDFISREVW